MYMPEVKVEKVVAVGGVREKSEKGKESAEIHVIKIHYSQN